MAWLRIVCICVSSFLFDSNRYVSDGGYTVLTIDKSSFEQNLVVPVQNGHDSVPTIALHSCGSVFKNPEITIKIVENEKEVDVFISILHLYYSLYGYRRIILVKCGLLVLPKLVVITTMKNNLLLLSMYFLSGCDEP